MGSQGLAALHIFHVRLWPVTLFLNFRPPAGKSFKALSRFFFFFHAPSFFALTPFPFPFVFSFFTTLPSLKVGPLNAAIFAARNIMLLGLLDPPFALRVNSYATGYGRFTHTTQLDSTVVTVGGNAMTSLAL